MKIETELLSRIISHHYLALIPNFYLYNSECDLFTLNKNLYTTEYEVKRSKADYNLDFKKKNGNKHRRIKNGERTNRFYFVLDIGVAIDAPDYAGLIYFSVKKSGTVVFTKLKHAPILHKQKADKRIVHKCTATLSWRYYEKLRKEHYESNKD